MADLKDTIAALRPRVAGNPPAMLALARMLRKQGEEDEAVALCRSALVLAPGDARLGAEANAFIAGSVARWHFSIVRDDIRNAAYDAALRRAAPGKRVLEIGAGTGLLSMMAARAGASHVTSCEMVPAIADKAREIVAHNGLADRVAVVGKKSDVLTEDDMGGRADILVSEIVSNTLLGEDVLPAHEDAMRRLMKPGAQVIPARGAIRVALAQDTRAEDKNLGNVDGFDLSPFNSFADPVRHLKISDKRIIMRSAPHNLFDFDFAATTYRAPGRAAVTCRSEGGVVNGVIQWIALEMDDVTHYENQPGTADSSCWAVLFHPFAAPVETAPGDEIRIAGAHDRHNITIWQDA